MAVLTTISSSNPKIWAIRSSIHCDSTGTFSLESVTDFENDFGNFVFRRSLLMAWLSVTLAVPLMDGMVTVWDDTTPTLQSLPESHPNCRLCRTKISVLCAYVLLFFDICCVLCRTVPYHAIIVFGFGYWTEHDSGVSTDTYYDSTLVHL